MNSVKMTGRFSLAVVGACALLAGCVSETTTDFVESVTNTVKKVVSSTTPDSQKSAFVNDRFQAIRYEAAKGEGENVEALAALLGEPDRKAFAHWMKTNYVPLFADLRKPDELLLRIQSRRDVSS